MASKTEPFKHQPLKLPTSTRIVTLLRGSGDDTIKCLVHDYDISHLLKNDFLTRVQSQNDAVPLGGYRALSYEWGIPSNFDSVILLNEHYIRIRKNLHDALLHIRRGNEDVSLWIDALSIDQSNIQERSQQVNLMGDIYRGADEVIAWLGLARDGSDFVMELFHTKHDKMTTKIKDLQQEELQYLVAFCTRPYWSRVWILQEVYNARSLLILCGSRTITGEKFSETVAYPWSDFKIERECSRSLDRSGACLLMQAKYVIGKVPSFNTLRRWISMSLKSGCESTEPRDYVYAMLGIASDYPPVPSSNKSTIIPDYEKPLLELYFETIAFWGMHAQYKDAESLLAKKLDLKFDDIHSVTKVAQKYNVEFEDSIKSWVASIEERFFQIFNR